MILTEQQKQRFEMVRQMAKEDLDQLEQEIRAELARVKETLMELQQAKKAVKQIYDGACARMGIKPTLEMSDLNLTDLMKCA